MHRTSKRDPTGRIRFLTEKISFTLPQKSTIRKWILETLITEGFSASHIDYIFCTDKFLLSLNKQFLDHDFLTDILTFDYTSENTPEELSGEIYISIPRVRENAKKFSVSFEEELYRMIIHGILHLCGYQDKKPADQKRMRRKENDYLILLKNK